MRCIRTVRKAITVLATAVVLAACGQVTEVPGTAVPPADQTAEPLTAVQVPDELKFTANTLDGKPFNARSLAGKPAVLWFWAPWCPSCNAEAPAIAKVAGSYGGRVTFVGVASSDTLPAMREFVDKHGIDAFTHVNDETAAVFTRFRVTAIPTVAIVAADGTVETGVEMPASELRAKLDALLD